MRDTLRGSAPEHRIISELARYFRGSAGRARRGAVLLADQQHRRRADALELIHHRLGENHLGNARAAPGDNISAWPGIHAAEHIDPTVVFGLPFTAVVEFLLILLDTLEA